MSDLVKTEKRFYDGRDADVAERIEREVDEAREEWQATDPSNEGLDLLAYVYLWNADETDIVCSGILDEFTVETLDGTYEVEFRYLDLA